MRWITYRISLTDIIWEVKLDMIIVGAYFKLRIGEMDTSGGTEIDVEFHDDDDDDGL